MYKQISHIFNNSNMDFILLYHECLTQALSIPFQQQISVDNSAAMTQPIYILDREILCRCQLTELRNLRSRG
jgi:hypothetical protein